MIELIRDKARDKASKKHLIKDGKCIACDQEVSSDSEDDLPKKRKKEKALEVTIEHMRDNYPEISIP